MKKLLIPLLLIVVFSPLSLARASLLKEDQTLTVTGIGVVETAPDTAAVRLGVEVLRKTAQEAQTDNAGIMQKVISAMEKLNISKDRIATSNFNIWPELKYESNQAAKLVGYRCSDQITITLDDVKLVSKVIDSGITAGATSISGIQFSKKDDLEAKKTALEKAVKEAQAKAQALAAAAGRKIKSIKNIVESNAVLIVPENDLAIRSMATNSGVTATPISSGMVEIRGGVTINYIIE